MCTSCTSLQRRDAGQRQWLRATSANAGNRCREGCDGVGAGAMAPVGGCDNAGDESTEPASRRSHRHRRHRRRGFHHPIRNADGLVTRDRYSIDPHERAVKGPDRHHDPRAPRPPDRVGRSRGGGAGVRRRPDGPRGVRDSASPGARSDGSDRPLLPLEPRLPGARMRPELASQSQRFRAAAGPDRLPRRPGRRRHGTAPRPRNPGAVRRGLG